MGTLIFCDSFDHYDNLTFKWSSAAGGIDLSGTSSRTGIGCCQLGGVDGPFNLLPTALTRLVLGGAFFPNGSASNPKSQIFIMHQITTASIQVLVGALPDMSVAIFNSTPTGRIFLGASAPAVLFPQAYNYIEVDAQISHDATVVVNVNGVTVLTLNHVDTIEVGSLGVVDSYQLKAFGGSATGRWDDFYALSPDPGSPVGSQFLGPVRIYAAAPTANGSPVNWTPISGSNFQNVDDIPQDTGTYNTANAVGVVDQYSYPATGVPAGSSIIAIQHVMDLSIDSGSRTVASQFGAQTGPTLVLTTSFQMLSAPYTANPSSGNPWTIADFPLQFGPKVTA